MLVRHDMVYCFAARPGEGGGSYEFLQLRRAPDDFMGGTWQPVCGRIEGKETAWQAAVRELREEAGLSARELYVIEFVNSFYIPSQDTMWHCTNFLALIDAGAPVVLSSEHDAFRWIAEAQVHDHFMWPGDRRAIAEALREILGDGPGKQYLRIPL